MAKTANNNGILGRALGATLALTAAFAPLGGAAQEVTPAAQLPEPGSAWTDELRDFDQAATAARDYAENNNGIGILIHVGTEAAAREIEHNIGQQIAGWLANPKSIPQDFIDTHCPDFSLIDRNGDAVQGVEAQYFLSYNDVSNTGVTYHVGRSTEGAHNGTEVKGLIEGICAIPDVAEALHVDGMFNLSSLETETALVPAPALGNN